MSENQLVEGQKRVALERGPHKLTLVHAPFLQEEFALMVRKWQWVVFPLLVDKKLLGMRLILPGVKEERDRRLQWLGGFSSSNINCKTLPISALSAMQYG